MVFLQKNQVMVAEEKELSKKEAKANTIDFVHKLLETKKKVQADIKKDGKNPEFFKSLEPLLKRNAERGTPVIEEV
jgi:hypothetical protein